MATIANTTFSDPNLKVLYACMDGVCKKTFNCCDDGKTGLLVSGVHSTTTTMPGFELELEEAVNALQKGIEPPPEIDVLNENLKAFEQEYHSYKEAYWKNLNAINEVRSVVGFFNPQVRTSVEEEALKDQAPKLYEEIAQLEGLKKGWVEKFEEPLRVLESVSKSMSETLNRCSTQLCQYGRLVANKGDPVGIFSLVSYQIPAPILPEQKEIAIEQGAKSCADPYIAPFFEQKQEVFDTYRSSAEKIKISLSGKLGTLAQFFIKANSNGSVLQNQKVEMIPSQEKLEEDRKKMLTAYWKYRQGYQSAITFVKSTELVLSFVTPKPPVESAKFKAEAPAFYEQVAGLHEVQTGWVKILKDLLGIAETLRDKMGASFYDGDWSIQRFCQIVEREGQPLGKVARVLNRCMPYNIPKLENLTKKEENSKESDKQSTESSNTTS